ncbi:hypothetical protein FA95DRAFT_1614360 [Auriscalpium vulgare]|uniref:Uncharacterized protein n=1 Tax=Auriscalpium vulgare TaxID=40419 RepID=A0ACB8R079_9AGAM|nr:hypothetical protein FA95DRAFT_1614360 [Auriscalpium vulgare]
MLPPPRSPHAHPMPSPATPRTLSLAPRTPSTARHVNHSQGTPLRPATSPALNATAMPATPTTPRRPHGHAALPRHPKYLDHAREEFLALAGKIFHPFPSTHAGHVPPLVK